MSDVRSDLSELAALDLRDAGKLEDASEWTMRQRIKKGEYETYVDGNRRKITLRSIKARRDRLLKDQAPSPTIPPADAWMKSAEVRAERRRLAGADGPKPQSSNAPRRGRSRKGEPAATTA